MHLSASVTLAAQRLQSAFIFAVVLLLGGLLISPTSLAAENLSHADKSAYSYIISPNNGDTVPTEFTVKFGLSGMGIAPAGIDKVGTGHHHLLIDVNELPNLDEPLAATNNIKHFGGGQTEASISLSPGEHTLQLLLGN